MPVRHEIRSGKDRPKTSVSSSSKSPPEPVWSKRSYGSSEDDDKLYEPDWEIADTDLGPYIDISLRD
jgi:hypothetical protein